MSKKIDAYTAESILADVKPDQAFWVNNGSVVRNLHELVHALKGMDPATFQFHVTSSKNDFASWIYHVLKDEELSGDLGKIKNNEKCIRVIEKRIKELEKIASEVHLQEPPAIKKIFEGSDDHAPVPKADIDSLSRDWMEKNEKKEDLPQIEHPSMDYIFLKEKKEDLISKTPVEQTVMEPDDDLNAIKKQIIDDTYRRIAFEKLMNRILFLCLGLIAGILIGVYLVK